VPALDLGPGDGLSSPAANRSHLARVSKPFEEQFDGSFQQRSFRPVGEARLPGESGVNLEGNFQIRFSLVAGKKWSG
jgi:hypothetical protein